MKAVFVGGGAHRLFPVLRAALAEPGIFAGGEIHLYDPNVQRAEIMGRLLQKTPEYRKNPVKITWSERLEEALEGASAVAVVLMAGSALKYELGSALSFKQGFIGSDNVSLNGAFLAAKGAPILLELARKMERYCPDAWLLDFANPVAVLSGMVNRHTKIKALGVCQGYNNHQWDINRIFGTDAPSLEMEVETIGINHLSFIVEGTYRGRDLFEQLDQVLTADWKPLRFRDGWSEEFKADFTLNLSQLVQVYRELGLLVFSSEPDGMGHLFHDDFVAREGRKLSTPAQAEAKVKVKAAERAEANRQFEAHAGQELDDSFWEKQDVLSPFTCASDDIFVRMFRGISGVAATRVVSSRPNEGAIEGLPEDVMVEYGQVLYRDRIRATGRFRLPEIAHGLIAGLATHQTMLADACFANDPQLFARALQAYPVRAYSPQLKALCRDLVALHSEEIPAPLRGMSAFLR